MTKLRHYDHAGTARFITFSCYSRYPVLADPTAAAVLTKHLTVMREGHQIRILGYVLMPEHVHLVLHPSDEIQLGRVIGKLKARAAQEILHLLQTGADGIPQVLTISGRGARQHAVWERRCYDHNCRTADAVREKINYCHNNPVQRGLVSDPSEWIWSSHRWYLGDRIVPLCIDSISPP